MQMYLLYSKPIFVCVMNTLLKEKAKIVRTAIAVDCNAYRVLEYSLLLKNNFLLTFHWLKTLIAEYGEEKEFNYKLTSFSNPFEVDITHEGSLMLITNQIQISNLRRHPTIVPTNKKERIVAPSISLFVNSKPSCFINIGNKRD